MSIASASSEGGSFTSPQPFRKLGNDQHQIYLGDSLEVLKAIDAESVDLIFADPPYNIGKKYGDFIDSWPSEKAYVDWCKEWIVESLRILKPNGSIYIMTSTQAMPHLDLYLREQIEILSRIIWSYDSSGVQAKKYFGSMYEPIIYGVKNKNNYTFNSDEILIEAITGSKRKLIDYRKAVPTVYNSQKVPGNVWSYPRVRYRMEEYEEHPTQKPVALLERIIRASSNEGDVVLDPFAGSFTTNFVAKELNRKSIGIELNTDYVGIGLRRLGLATEFDGKELRKAKKIYDKDEVAPENLLKLDLE